VLRRESPEIAAPRRARNTTFFTAGGDVGLDDDFSPNFFGTSAAGSARPPPSPRSCSSGIRPDPAEITALLQSTGERHRRRRVDDRAGSGLIDAVPRGGSDGGDAERHREAAAMITDRRRPRAAPGCAQPGLIHESSGLVSALLASALSLVAASGAWAQSAPAGSTLSPDGLSFLVSKDLANERWAISLSFIPRFDSRGAISSYTLRSVSGNVFPTNGGPPAFIFCETTAASQGDLGNPDSVFGCAASARTRARRRRSSARRTTSA
jgi:hypothetical protein